MSFNTKKTVCMLFNPIERYKMVCNNFPQICLAGHRLSFVPVFKYLGTMRCRMMVMYCVS